MTHNPEDYFINEIFDGNISAAKEALIAGRKETIQFEDIKAVSTIFPELEEEGQLIIEKVLGYLPARRVTIPYEPYLRALIFNHKKGLFSKQEYSRQVVDHIKLIRDADMVPHSCHDYHPSIYKRYHQEYYSYGYAARARISSVLEYEPQLVHSIVAELWLREVIALDKLPLPGYLTPIDYKAMTIVKYREILSSNGTFEANTSIFILLPENSTIG